MAAIVLILILFSVFPGRVKNEFFRTVNLPAVRVDVDGPDFVFEACDILDKKYFAADSLNYPKILNSALGGLTKELGKYGINFAPNRIDTSLSKDEAKKQFAFEFERAEKLAKPLKDSIGHNLEFAATTYLLWATGDSHNYFIYPGSLAYHKKIDNGEKAFCETGISVGSVADTFFYVSDIFPCSPACGSGLKKFDRVLKINNADLSGKKIDEVNSFLSGNEGSIIELVLQRKDSIFSMRIATENIARPLFSIDTIEYQEKKFMYLRLYSFNFEDSSIQVIQKSLIDAQMNSDGIIIDLRDDLGGLMSTERAMLNMFLDKGTLAFYEIGRNQEDTSRYLTTDFPINSLPVVVLINGSSGSAAEEFAAILQENNKAILVGKQSCGCDDGSLSYPLSFGSAMNVGITKSFTGKGKRLEGSGITPDFIAFFEEESILCGQDSQIQKALEVLENQIDGK